MPYQNNKKNPKAINKSKTKFGIADLETENGKATTDNDKAEVFNNFFSGVLCSQLRI